MLAIIHQMQSLDLQLQVLKSEILLKDPKLIPVFNKVDESGFQLFSVIKEPYPALIGAIIGQKIRYEQAKNLRSLLYSKFTTYFTPDQIYNGDLSFLPNDKVKIIRDVTEYILANDLTLTKENIEKLDVVKGIGIWTIQTTLLTCLYDFDVFPLDDKFIQVRMKRIYGNDVNMKVVSEVWAPYRSLVTWYLWRWF
jgi:3-methyladenine DNA glycosylase/8-oxoguanine DNA glycosylase